MKIHILYATHMICHSPLLLAIGPMCVSSFRTVFVIVKLVRTLPLVAFTAEAIWTLDRSLLLPGLWILSVTARHSG